MKKVNGLINLNEALSTKFPELKPEEVGLLADSVINYAVDIIRRGDNVASVSPGSLDTEIKVRVLTLETVKKEEKKK